MCICMCMCKCVCVCAFACVCACVRARECVRVCMSTRALVFVRLSQTRRNGLITEREVRGPTLLEKDGIQVTFLVFLLPLMTRETQVQ